MSKKGLPIEWETYKRVRKYASTTRQKLKRLGRGPFGKEEGVLGEGRNLSKSERGLNIEKGSGSGETEFPIR